MTMPAGRDDVAEVTLSRSLTAPRALVWRAWTEPELLSRWWGPNGFTTPVCEIDPRPGGTLYLVMRAPGGTDYPMTGVYRDVAAPTHLAYSFQPRDADGGIALDGHTIVTFGDDQHGSQLVIQSRATALAVHARRMLEGMEAGWTQSIDRLARLTMALTGAAGSS